MKRRGQGAEQKLLTVSGTLNTDTTGLLTLLNGCSPGTAIDQRIGRRIHLKSINVRALSVVGAASGVDQVHRVVIFVDHQANGSVPAVLDVLASSSVYSQYNPSYTARFDVLLDKTVYLNATAEPGSGQVWQWRKGLGAYETRFNSGTAGTVADITTNSLYILTLGSVAAGATSGNTVINSVVQYADA